MSKTKLIGAWLLIGAVVFLAGMMFQEQSQTIRIGNTTPVGTSGTFQHEITLKGLEDIRGTSSREIAATELTKHFVEQMPEKAKTNIDLLRIYVEAYRQMASTVKSMK